MVDELVSVIIPIYNGESYIKNITKAICNQTYDKLEIIVVDDGSKDDTLNLCKKYMGADERFKIYSQENSGASSARNYGIKKATGKYIAFVDVDDYIYPQYFEYLYSLLIEYNADMACCSYIKMRVDEKEQQFKNDNNVKEFNSKEAMLDLLYRRNITGYPYLKMYKKSIIENIEFPKGVAYGEDFVFTFWAIKQCEKVVYGTKILYIYYQNNNSSTHKMVDYSEYNNSWEIHKNEILEYARKENVELLNAAYAKLFILAIDYSCRIWNVQEEKRLKDELVMYISFADSIVLKNKQCKFLNRTLAFFSCINPTLMIQLCRIYNSMKEIFHFETRRSV